VKYKNLLDVPDQSIMNVCLQFAKGTSTIFIVPGPWSLYCCTILVFFSAAVSPPISGELVRTCSVQ
jgi:hypothetical protein